MAFDKELKLLTFVQLAILLIDQFKLRLGKKIDPNVSNCFVYLLLGHAFTVVASFSNCKN